MRPVRRPAEQALSLIYLKVNSRSSSKVASAVGDEPLGLPTADSFRRSAAFYREQAAREDDDWRAETLFLIAADFEAMAANMTLAQVGDLALTSGLTASSCRPRPARFSERVTARFGRLCGRLIDLGANGFRSFSGATDYLISWL